MAPREALTNIRSWDQNTVVSLHGFPKHRGLPSWRFLVAEPNRQSDNFFTAFDINPLICNDFNFLLRYDPSEAYFFCFRITNTICLPRFLHHGMKTSWSPYMIFQNIVVSLRGALLDPEPKQFGVLYCFGSWDQNTEVSLHDFPKHRGLPFLCFCMILSQSNLR